MAKETKLTVMVPITSADCENPSSPNYNTLGELEAAIPASEMNVNSIYKVAWGIFYRSQKNADDDGYSYQRVYNREFPFLGRPLEIFDFTYDATRMGTASTITAQNVPWYADKDSWGEDITLDDLWSDDCFVVFNNETFHLKQIPTSKKDNEDARYKYDIDFVSQDVILETSYIFDTVTPYDDNAAVSDTTEFSFFGDIVALKNRINASLIKDGISAFVTRNSEYFSYKDWGDIAIGVYNGTLPTTRYSEVEQQDISVIAYYNGSYARYLQSEVLFYDAETQEFEMSGYKVVIGHDARGEVQKSDQKLLIFENNTIHEALQKIKDDFGLQYYKKRDGNTLLIVIGDCEYDFGDRDSYGNLIRGNDGLPMTSEPFSYGVNDELISIEKTNNTEKIITSITGHGSDVNIPWHYPNPTPDGWLKPIYNSHIQGATQPTVSYPKVESETDFENFIKNRIGANFVFGLVDPITYTVQDASLDRTAVSGNKFRINYTFNNFTFSRIKPFSLSMSVNIGISPENLSFSVYHKVGNSFVCDYTYNFESGQSGYAINQMDSPSTWNAIPDGAEMRFVFSFTVPKSIFEYTIDPLYYHSEVKWAIRGGFWNNWPFSSDHNAYLPAIFSNVQLEAITDRDNDTEKSYYSRVGQSSSSPYQEWGNVHIYNQDYIYVYDANGRLNKLKYANRGYESLMNCPRWVWRLYESKTGYKPYGTSTFYWYNYDVAESDVIAPPEIVTSLVAFNLTFNDLEWFREGATFNPISLSDYGITLSYPTGVSSNVGDTITFKRVKYLTPQKNLMPEVYIKTDGARRFYPSHNYEPVRGRQSDIDSALGEEWQNESVTIHGVISPAGIRNPIYKDVGENTHYLFEKEIVSGEPLQHIENFDDVKPTIHGQKVNNLRIDVVEEFAYDRFDDDTIWAGTGNENDNTYKHPHFFAKLRPLGFNIFDHALQDDMVISITTGHCGACNFKIKVDEKTKKNPVQVWPRDAYKKTIVDGTPVYTKVYNRGDLVRYSDDDLYWNAALFYLPYRLWWRYSDRVGLSSQNTYFDDLLRVYTEEQVANGTVGTLQQEGVYHFEGDVVTSGSFIDTQQDTTSNYVWVALEKDIDTYGTIMPSAPAEFTEAGLRPLSIADVHTENSTNTEDEEKADKFVIINIRLPLQYIRNAERDLSKALVKYMFENNYQKFNFSIKFSRVFLAQNEQIGDLLNENSVLYVKYYGTEIFRQYVQHYSYRVNKDEALPEISVDMREDLSAVTNHVGITVNDGYSDVIFTPVLAMVKNQNRGNGNIGAGGVVGQKGGVSSGINSGANMQDFAILKTSTRKFEETTKKFEAQTKQYADEMTNSVNIIKRTLNPDSGGVPSDACYWQDDPRARHDTCREGEVHYLPVPDFGELPD